MSNLKNGVKSAPGGKRKGSGRKPALLTQLRQLAIEKASGEAEKSLAFCVSMRDNPDAQDGIRLEAAKLLMERVWGRPKQAFEHSGGAVGRFVLICPNEKT